MQLLGALVNSALLISGILKLSACSAVSIVGGHVVKPHSRPWMASLQANKQHVCGGTLINEQWVLTAAHCQRSLGGDVTAVTVLLGAHSLKKEGTRRVAVERWFIPSTFDNVKLTDDIMLIKLIRKVKADKKTIRVKEVPKKPGKDLRSGTECQVTGWGAIKATDKNGSDVLREAVVEVVDRELCSCYYNNKPVITEDMLCAANKKTQADACMGDSGGPLECGKALVGVVSGGKGCGDPKKPGVYTLLSKRHLSWVHKTLKGQTTGTSGVIIL